MSRIDLGIVYKPHPKELLKLNEALTEFTGDCPQEKILIGLAGPNEVVQIILNATSWMNIIKFLSIFLGGKFAASYVSELGKQAAVKSMEHWQNKRNYLDLSKRGGSSSFIKLSTTIKALREKGQTITIAVKLPGSLRNAGLIITTDNTSEIAWQLACLALKTEIVQNIYLEIIKNGENLKQTGDNSDMSLEIKLTDNGDIIFLGEILK